MMTCEQFQPKRRFRVTLRSAPGMWELYDGFVDVYAQDGEDAFREAVRKLARTSFPDRPSMSSWIFESAEVLA